MMGHLSDEELTEYLLDRDQRRLRPALDALEGWARTIAERPESFWERQRAAARARLAARKRRAAQRLGVLAGAVCLVLFALILVPGNHHQRKAPARAQTDPDQELLLRVEQTMQSAGPQALQPAALLAEEISRGANSRAGARHPAEGEKQP
jgi:hypothetical protein